MKRYFLSIITLVLSISCLISCGTKSNPITTQNNKDNNFNSDKTEAINPNYHTITFQTNNGSKISPITTNILNSAPTPTREGHLFDGWYFDTGFTNAVSFPFEITNDTILYAKWLKIKGEQSYKNISLKMGLDESGSKSSYVDISELDLERLYELNYKINFKITYEVKYAKEYNIAFDIGYMGAPLYEVSLNRSDNKGNLWHNIKTTKEYKSDILMTTFSPEYLLNKTPLTITFSTDNIQNRIYFKNIIVSYECVKR